MARLASPFSVPLAAFRGIVDSVRTTVLEWALKLEEDGIVDEGLSFSSTEKALAANPVYHNVMHSNREVIGSQIQQGTSGSTMSTDEPR